MNFTNPDNVISPKGVVKDVRVIFNTGEGGWSLAKLQWEGKEVMGVRWNGHSENTLGNPQSRGIATWFVLPDEITGLIHTKIGEGGLQPHENPEEGHRLRLRPLPRRIWQGQEQEPRDDVWVVTQVNKLRGSVGISNPATGHFLTLYAAHTKEFIPDSVQDANGGTNWILNMSVQMVFQDGHVRLEPMGF